ncbi:MAG: ATP-binding protein [Breznakibacter sp.]
MRQNTIHRLVEKIKTISDSPISEFQHTLLTKVLQITIGIAFFGSVINLFIDLSFLLTLVGAVTCSVFGVLLYLSKQGKKIRLVKYTYIALCVLVLNALWLTNGGIDGTGLIMSMMFLIIILFLTYGPIQKIIIATYILNITGLFAIHLFAPQFIPKGYTSETQRFIDHMAMFYIIIVATIPVFLFIQRSYITGKKKAEESERVKTSFLANMSHEIRTPMNSILGFSELLRDPALNENDKQYFLEIIQDNGKVLLQLLNNIMEMSKLDAKIVKPNLRGVDISKLLEQVYISNKPDLDEKGEMVRFKLIIPDNGSTHLFYTDELMVYQIMSNLLGNAIKFTTKGKIEMGYELDRRTHGLYLYVMDTGIGIDSERINNIFNRFTQADDNYTRRYGGVGLGLAISQELARLLKGDIKIESTVGKGSKFIVLLPQIKMSAKHMIQNHQWN